MDRSVPPSLADVNEMLEAQGEVARHGVVVHYFEQAGDHKYLDQDRLLVATDTGLITFKTGTTGTFKKRSFVKEQDSFKYGELWDVRVSVEGAPVPCLYIYRDELEVGFLHIRGPEAEWDALVRFVLLHTSKRDPMQPEAAAAPRHAAPQKDAEERDEGRPLESSVTKAQKELAQEFWTAGITIINATGESEQKVAEANAKLDAAAARVRALRAQLDDDQFDEAFDHYFWAERSSGYAQAFAKGLDRDAFREILWQWARTFASPLSPPVREPAAPRPGRPWAYVPQGASFTYVESLRVNLPDGDGAYATLEELGESLAEKLGRPPFAGVALDDVGRCITPWWASVRDAYLHASGDVTATGWPTHALFWLPHVLDLGAVDGRNRDRWSGQAPQGMARPNDHLYVGSNRESRFEMSAVAGSVQSLDLTRDGLRVLCLEDWGSSRFLLGWADARTGERRYLLDPGRLSGGERVQLSPDERWALLSAYPEPLLIDLEAAAVVRLPTGKCAGASWWPAAGASIVAALLMTDDGMHLARLDLASGTSTDEGPLVIPPNDLPPDRQHVSDLVVHPRRNEALVGASFGTPWSHQEKYGGRRRVAHLDLETRRVDLLVAPFLDDDPRLERQHSKWRWTGEPDAVLTVVAEAVRAHAVPMAGGPPADAAYVATDARDLAVFAGRALVQHWDDPHRVRSEALRGFEGSCRWGRNEKLAQWFAAITEEIAAGTASMAAETGSRALPAHARAALAFAAAERKISEGRAGEIDWAAGSMTDEVGRAEDVSAAKTSEGTLTLADGRSFSHDVQCSDCEHWGTRHICRASAGPRSGDITEPVSACDSFSVGTGQVLLFAACFACAADQTQEERDLLREALGHNLADEDRIYATCTLAELLIADQPDEGVALWEQALVLDRASGVQKAYELRDMMERLDAHYAGVGDQLVNSGEWREAIPFLEKKLSLCDHMPVNPLIFTATILGPLWWMEGHHTGPRSLERRGADLLRTVIATKEIDLFGSFGDTVRGIAQRRMDTLEELRRKGA